MMNSPVSRCAFALAAFVVVCGSAAVHSQGPLFAPAAHVVVGPGSGQIVLVDVNRDGHLDMLTRHLLQRRVAVFLGDGKAGFTAAPGSPIALGYQPGAIAVADVNGDTMPDLAVSISERDSVDVFPGNGRGGFSRASGSPFRVSESVEFYTRLLHIADVNGDRRLDIMTANGRENSFGILFGDGSGGFSPGPTIKQESNRAGRHAFAFGDVDGDGHVDVVSAGGGDDTTSAAGRASILRGDGKGAFREPGPPLMVAPGPHFVTLADTTGNHRLDIVITHSGTQLLTVLLNDGRGVFTRAPGSPFDIRAEGFAVVVADADRDGRADVLAATGGGVSVLLADGRGGFVTAPGAQFPAGPGAYNLTVGDINDDGKLDAVAASFEGTAVTMLLGR